jgi:hypothetical protein
MIAIHQIGQRVGLQPRGGRESDRTDILHPCIVVVMALAWSALKGAFNPEETCNFLAFVMILIVRCFNASTP